MTSSSRLIAGRKREIERDVCSAADCHRCLAGEIANAPCFDGDGAVRGEDPSIVCCNDQLYRFAR
jgi:hypothetical protein